MLISAAFPGLRNPSTFNSDQLRRKYFKNVSVYLVNHILQNNYSEIEQVNTYVWYTTTYKVFDLSVRG